MRIFDLKKKKKTEQSETSITNKQAEQSELFENDLSREDSVLVTEEVEIIVPKKIVISEIQES